MSDANKVIPFIYDENPIRVVKDDAGEPWFVAKDVCAVLEHTNPAMAVDGLDDDEKGIRKVYTPGGLQEMLTVSESGLYTLVIRSNKQQAKIFRRWVTHEVLPALRKIGSYSIPGTEQAEQTTMSALVNLVSRMVSILEKHGRILSALEARVSSDTKTTSSPLPPDPDMSITADFFEFRKLQTEKINPDVRRFLITKTVIDPESSSIMSWLYSMYEQWCFSNCTIPQGRNTFYADLRLAVSGYGEVKATRKSQLYITGIRMRAEKE